MSKVLSRLSLKYQIMMLGLAGVGGLAFAGLLFFHLTTQMTIQQAEMNRLADEEIVALRLESSLLEARRSEKDFLLRTDDRQVERHEHQLGNARQLLSAIQATIDGQGTELAAKLQDIGEGLGTYGGHFGAVVESRRRLGYSEKEGLEGELRSAVHSVEKLLGEHQTPELSVLMLMMRRHEKDFMLRIDESYIERLETRIKEFKALLARTDAVPVARKSEIQNLMQAYQTSFLAFAKERLGLQAHLADLSGSYASFEPLVESLFEVKAAHFSNAREKTAQIMADLKQQMLMLLGLAFAVVTIFSLWLARSVSQPLIAVTAALQGLAGGRTDVAIPEDGRRDEIGAIAKSMLVFRDNIIRNAEMEAEQEAEKKRTQMEKAKMVVDLADNFQSAVGLIATSLSGSAHEMEQAAHTLTATSDETSAQAATVASASEEASSNVQTVAAAAEQLAASVKEIGQQVALSTRMSQEATHKAETTAQEVAEMAQKAEKVGDIVALIQQIASQTNLLALNATIEAARAGEAGKGFAVVAAEVKNLADQTARATVEISEQIGSIQGATASSSQSMGAIARFIRDLNEIATSIASAVEEQGAATQEIARNVQEAACGTRDVSTAIAGVTEAATSSSAAAAKVLSTASGLTRQSGELQAAVRTFIEAILDGPLDRRSRDEPTFAGPDRRKTGVKRKIAA